MRMNRKKSEAGDRTSELKDILAHLQDSSQVLSNRLLAGLSDLSSEEVKAVDAVWNNLDTPRKRALISRLKELAEDNVEYYFGALLKHAMTDADDAVRREAIEGLWEDEEPSLIRPLLNTLEHDPADNVREAAAMALGRFATLAECHKIEGDYIPRLSRALLQVVNNASEPLSVRRRALEAVAPLSLADVTQAIWAAYRREEPEMKASAIRAMGLNCDLLWLPTVMQELGNDNPELRYEAAGAAGLLGEVEASVPLIELLEDPDPDVRLAAVQALGKVGGAEAKRVLRHILRHKDQSMRDAAATALGEVELFEEPFSAQGPE